MENEVIQLKQESLNNLADYLVCNAIKYQYMIYNHYVDKNFIKIEEIRFYNDNDNNDTVVSKVSKIISYKDNNVASISVDIKLITKRGVSNEQKLYTPLVNICEV